MSNLNCKNFKVGDTLSLNIENQELTSKWCSNYQNTNGGVGVVTDSWGMISIFLSNGDASKLLNCKDGSKVTIKAESLTKRLNLKWKLSKLVILQTPKSTVS